ncbi:hypothetical protein [Ancylobacter terrae]|uniref:hypothetical protein n=1 Tax=Ancylobacter sp. sgz301288 TaxID=3342077 RepID=UPI00385A29ED
MNSLGRGRADHGSVGARAAADVAYLSGSMFADGVSDPRDAADLLAFDQLVVPEAAEWSRFLIGAIATHLLVHEAPADILDDAKAQWLIAALAPAGRMESARGMPLLLRLMEGAREVSPLLPAFALRQLGMAVITGEGPVAAGRAHFTRTVDDADVALMRRLLIAGGGGQGGPVSRAEADALFDIHDATLEGRNDPGFAPLFVRAIEQHLRAASGQRVAARGAALAASANGAHLAIEKLAAAGYQPDLASLVGPAPLAAAPARWLAERLLRDGRISPSGHALKRLIVADGADAGDSLRALLDRAA